MGFSIDNWCRHCHRVFLENWGGGGFRGLTIEGATTYPEPPPRIGPDGGPDVCSDGCCPECQNIHGPRQWREIDGAWFVVEKALNTT
jgi:hypothetical protein